MLKDNTRLQSLGLRLRAERLKRNEAQKKFAARLGVSVPTLAKMESGHPGVQIGNWLTALGILDRSSDIDAILAEPVDLFAEYDKAHAPARKRASRRLP